MSTEINKDRVILEATDVVRQYHQSDEVITAVNHASMKVYEGEFIAIVGASGSGKSTLIKLINDLLTVTSGKILINGEEIGENSKKIIAYLPERTYFNSWMRVEELITYFRDFFPDFDETMARKMLSDLSIDVNAKLRTLSKGNKEKVQLVLVMSRRAKLYLLDEPIGGVDPAARDYILSTIIGSYNPDAAVIITTHLIHDIEPVLDEFAFMGFGGRILLSGVADEVRAEQGKTLDELFREVFRC